MQALRSAIILAAGRGTRLGAVTRALPKGMLELGGETIIERSIRLLTNVGIDEVLLVTGHMSEHYDRLAADNPAVRTLHNEHYARSGSMYSLYSARAAVSAPFLLLDSDIIYEQRGLEALLESDDPNGLLTSGFTQAGDECYVYAIDGRLEGISKTVADLKQPIGEMVGITRISKAMFLEMIAYAKSYFEDTRDLEYEACMTAIARSVDIRCCLIPDLVWAEIDDAAQLARATRSVMPTLQARESKSAGQTVEGEPDPLFANPRLAAIYDALDGDRSDLEHYLAICHELEARSVLDVGCGTGSLACLLADEGIEVVGVDPAEASLAVARTKPGAEAVRWIHGDAATLPPLQVDLATMTGNVAQVFLSDEAWDANLRRIAGAVRPGGRLVFETRIPARRAWEAWTPEASRRILEIPDIGSVETWVRVTEVSLPTVSFRHHFRFESDGALLSSDSTLRFREREEIEASLDRCGWTTVELRGAPDRPGLEYVFIAQRR